jgi:hypothetical protein
MTKQKKANLCWQAQDWETPWTHWRLRSSSWVTFARACYNRLSSCRPYSSFSPLPFWGLSKTGDKIARLGLEGLVGEVPSPVIFMKGVIQIFSQCERIFNPKKKIKNQKSKNLVNLRIRHHGNRNIVCNSHCLGELHWWNTIRLLAKEAHTYTTSGEKPCHKTDRVFHRNRQHGRIIFLC